ncbi:hypothetical protein [Cryobacterium sp. AP23]
MPDRAVLAALLLTSLAALGGCSASDGTPAPPIAHTDRLGCGIVVTPAAALVGGEVVVSRPPAGPGDRCTTLAPGTTQTLELRSVHVNDPVRQTATVTVGDDGSFEATLPVPTGIRLERVVVTAIPPAGSDCTAAAAAAGTPDDCYFPRAMFTAAFDPADLSPVRIISTDAAMPALPADDGDQDSYAQARPGPHELTLVIFDSGCASRPAAYRHDAAAGNLEIVSEVIIPAEADGCTEQLAPWTTVIAVPKGYRDYTIVTVDNLSTVLLD